MSDKLQAREWLINGGAGHEDGADGLRASMWNSEAVIEALDDYREYLLEAALIPPAPTDDALYAAYAQHCAIQGTVPLTAKRWRKAGKPNAPQPVQPASASLPIHADTLVGRYCEGNALKIPQPIDWAAWQRVADYVNAALAAQPGVRSPDLVIERMRDWNYGAFLDETEASCIAIGTTAQEALNNGMRELLKRQPGVREGELSEDDLHELAEDIICRYGRAKDPATHDPKQWDLHVTGVERLLRAALLRSKESA